MHQDVVLAKVGMNQTALLVQRADQEDHVSVHTAQLLQGNVGVL